MAETAGNPRRPLVPAQAGLKPMRQTQVMGEGHGEGASFWVLLCSPELKWRRKLTSLHSATRSHGDYQFCVNSFACVSQVGGGVLDLLTSRS